MSTPPDLSSKRAGKDQNRQAGLPVDGEDLLIRSASTILRWMHNSTDDPSSQPQDRPRRGHFLDRVALTFVPGTGPADVAAVIYWDRVNSRLLVDADPGQHGFDVVKNSPLLKEETLTTTSAEDPDLVQSLKDDMYRFFYERGVDAISVTMHASMIQWLLNEVHSPRNSNTEIKAARRNLRHYIYMYCTCKIWPRITARAPRFGCQIAHFFLSKNGKDLLLTQDAFDIESEIPTTSHLRDQDEKWLFEQLASFDRTVEYKLVAAQVAGSGRVLHLVLTKEVLWSLYRFAAGCIRRVRQAVLVIRNWIQKPQRQLSKQNFQRMQDLLEDIHSSFYRLHHLLHRCPSFWRLVEVLCGISLKELEVIKRRRESGGDGEVNASSVDTSISSMDSAVSRKDMTPRRHGSTSEAHLGCLPDDTLADEAGLSMIHGFSDVLKAWLQLITRWYQAVQDLCDGETVRAAVQHGFVISATTAAQPEMPHRQQSLVATLWNLAGQPTKWSVEQARDAIKARATELVQSMKLRPQEEGTGAPDDSKREELPPTIHDRRLKALRILADFSEESIQQWEEAFEGCVHCEIDLACRMYNDDKGICEDLIGISKRCCSCCRVALSALYPHFKGISTHGKTYHWAPPPGTPAFVKRWVISHLMAEFDRFVRRYLNPNDFDESRPMTTDSSRGSNSGSVSSPTPSSIVDASSLDDSVRSVIV